MGSLYDIGNFRYKHFTFYSPCEAGRDCFPYEGQSALIDTEIKNFLNKVWPYRGVLIGDSSEGDYAFVTYVHNELNNQQTPTQIVDNIYTYTRIQLGTGEPQWVQATTPKKTLERTTS